MLISSNVIAQRHILEGPHTGGFDPQIELGRDFCTMHQSLKFRHPMFTRSEVIVLTNKHTNRRRWKHPTLFATLRRWVIIATTTTTTITRRPVLLQVPSLQRLVTPSTAAAAVAHGIKVVRLKVAIDKRLTVVDERSPAVLKYKTPHFRYSCLSSSQHPSFISTHCCNFSALRPYTSSIRQWTRPVCPCLPLKRSNVTVKRSQSTNGDAVFT